MVAMAVRTPLKFAFCLFKHFPSSGLSRDFQRILTECQNRGHEAEVFVSTWEGSKPEGTEITVLGDWIDNFSPNHVKDRRYYLSLQKKLNAKPFDAVIGFNKMPGLTVYYGADFCYVAREHKAQPPRRKLRLLQKILLRAPGFDIQSAYRLMPRYRHLSAFEEAVFGANRQTLILSLSEREKKVFQEYYHTPDSRFSLLPPTLAPDRKPVKEHGGTRQRIRQKFGIADNALLLLFIGSGFKTKGLDRALHALASLKSDLQKRSQLMVIGQDHPEDYRNQSKQLGIEHKVHFLGDRPDIPELLAAGDLLLHPAYRENTGTVLLEAIAAGVPVLTTDVCGYAHHVERANSGIVLSAPFEQDQLNRELTNVLASPMRSEWQANGLRYGENEDLYHMPTEAVDNIEQYCQRNLARDFAIATRSVGEIRYLDDRLSNGILRGASFEQIMQTQGQGELIRSGLGRRTSRLKFDGKSYYLKTHTGVGWPEIIKNWTYLRLPVLGAKNEWHGVHHLERLGINTLTIAGYGTSGDYAARQSFILTEEIEGSISLEELGYEWLRNPPRKKSELRYKRWLIRKIAEMARTIHQSGANHRDFYLCHFLLQRAYDDGELSIKNSKLYVIDLHRMQIRRETPERWKLKDISGLRYSCLSLIAAGVLTRRDLYRFISTYQSASLRNRNTSFWSGVVSKAESLRASEHRKSSQGSLEPEKLVRTTRAQH
jgi:UDP-glucose:(heptosyl)LPS alpha-1,3-glucosyltransferase